MKKLVVLSGAGMSAESGIPTFRGMGGLWEKYDVTELASPEGWAKDSALVQRFYNERRKTVLESKPNAGHYGLAELEKHFDVEIVTQNIDDLHERAGSTKILHLHGEIRKSRSTINPKLIYDIDGWELKMGDKCEEGSQLRPHIVWFGESVPELENAVKIVAKTDFLVVIGTSLQVYPAASLIDYAPSYARKFLIDPGEVIVEPDIEIIQKGAGEGVQILKEKLLSL
ncbi:MAG: NAD-dependent deacylase [Bacteroidetes bacterium]|nr:MAG: NAD-dependent deacylase [Bacteroidota bacterium]